MVTSRDGTEIGTFVSGAGQPLLLVHGTTADHRRWDGVTARFAEHFTVYAVDRRGRGASRDALDYHLLREAEDMAAVIEAVARTHGEPVYVVAHSYGAVCSLEAALLTDRIRRLVLYEPPIPTGIPMYPPGVPERIQALVESGDNEAALEIFLRETVRMPEEELAKYRQLPMWPGRVALAPTIAREITIDRNYQFEPAKFAEMRTPTLVLQGGESPPLFTEAAAVAAKALPNARVVVLPGQRHVAMDAAPEMFVKEVLDFLTGS